MNVERRRKKKRQSVSVGKPKTKNARRKENICRKNLIKTETGRESGIEKGRGTNAIEIVIVAVIEIEAFKRKEMEEIEAGKNLVLGLDPEEKIVEDHVVEIDQ